MKITTIEGITEHRLDNGLKVLLFPDPSKPTVTVNLTVFVGSRHEGYGEAGMAHLLEHMVFKGTPDHAQIPKLLKARGAEFNGTTSLDRTNYFETLAASEDNLEFAIRLEADRMVNSLIRAEDLASEMTVVRNEFERGENNPYSILGQRIMSAAFNWHNYGQATIGNRADIERVPVESLRAFYRRYYQPDNAMVVVAGRFDETKAMQLIDRHFGSIPKPDRELPATYTEEPAQDGERTVSLRRVGDVSVVGALYHIPAGGHPDFVALDVLESVLVMSPSGRLYKALVEQKKAASVAGAAYALHDPGILRFMAEVASGNSPDDVRDAMLDTIQSVADQGVTDEEVERARRRLLKQREHQSSDSQQSAIDLSEWAAQGDWRLYFLYRDRLEQVTTDDVNRVARAYLQPSNRTVGIYFPTKEAQRTPIPATVDLAQSIGTYQGRSDTAVGEAFDVDPTKIETRTRRLKIDGVKVALTPKKTRGSTVVLRLTLSFGTEKSLFGKGKVAAFLSSIMTKGTKSLSRQELQDELDKNLATLGSTSSAGEVTFVIQTKRDKLIPAIDLLRQVVREPSFPGPELEILKRGHASTLEKGMSDPQQLALKAVRRVLNPYPVGDVRYYPTFEEEIAQTGDVSIEQLQQLHSDFLGAQDGQLVVIGDFDEEATLNAMSGLLNGWKARQNYERIVRNADPDVKSDLVKIPTPDKANAFYFQGGVIPIRDDHPDYPALIIGNYIFGGSALSSRLGDRIRQKEGLSYGVGSSLAASSLDKRATMTMYAIFSPKDLDRIVGGIREELDRFLSSGVTQKEVEDARQGFLKGQEVLRTEDSELAKILEVTLAADRTMEFYAKMEQRIAELTPEKIAEAFRRHVDPKRMLTAVAGDWDAVKK